MIRLLKNATLIIAYACLVALTLARFGVQPAALLLVGICLGYLLG